VGDVRELETRRLALQASLDAAKTQAERNRLGQFATPTDMAMDMLAYARSLLPLAAKVRFLDPGFGIGSFYSALLRTLPADQIAAAEGFEIDPHYALPAVELWHDTPLALHQGDFTHAEPPTDESVRFNLIVCNPPYVRHHHIAAGDKLRLQQAAERACGIRLNGLTGLYCYFLCLCHAWLSSGGIAGWLVPSEFMDVNYGREVKRYLLDRVTLLRVHRFDPDELQFEDALVSSAIVWFRKATPPADHEVEFSFGGSLAQPRVSSRVPLAALRHERKWTRLPHPAQTTEPVGLTLGDLFTIKRGVATGDNRFFVLTREQIEARGLPLKLFRPVLPSPRYLHVDQIQADRDGNPALQPQLFLLNCNLPEEEVKTRYPALWAYLESGKERGVHEGYLCQHRSPWYAQEDRPGAMFLSTYMGRPGKNGDRPFRFILNRSQATATNVYLLLYPKPVLARRLREDRDLAVKIWQALDRISQKDRIQEGRVYGGGLYKLEPKELSNVPAAEIAALVSEDGDGAFDTLRYQQLPLMASP
jgi:predicted RNA methylase